MESINAEFRSGDVIKVHTRELGIIKALAKETGRYRICLHDNPDNLQHEMLICTARGDYSRPHKHIGISETHTIIEGRERIIIFDDNGKVEDSFLLDRDTDYISYRINAEKYHMSIPLTDTVIKLETKRGPFSPDSNVYPQWAPDGSDVSVICKYIEIINKESERITECING